MAYPHIGRRTSFTLKRQERWYWHIPICEDIVGRRNGGGSSPIWAVVAFRGLELEPQTWMSMGAPFCTKDQVPSTV